MKILMRFQCLLFTVFTMILVVIVLDKENSDTLDIIYKSTKSSARIHPGIPAANSNMSHSLSMNEHMRFYKLNPDTHYECSHIRRPKPEDITWRKDTYQKVVLKFESHPGNDVFGMKFYFDDRFLSETGERHLRGIVTVHGPGHLKNAQESRAVLEWAWAMNRAPWNVLLWYEGFKDPVGVTCTLQAAAGLNRNVSNTYFFQQIITCVIPEIGSFPTSASIVTQPCGQPTTYMEVVYPEQPPVASNKEIGVCMASFYGNMSRDNVPYLVNWMEALKLLGVNEVTINNGTLQFEDDVIRRTFQYYQDIGRLTFTHYPPVHLKWNSPSEDDAATEAVNKITTGDCIYRNLKKYWYALIIDMDELPVPTYFDTYQDYITDYTKKHSNLTHAHCLTVRSSFFYQEQEAGNPEYGAHLPILRFTKRFRPEPIEVDGVGISKSFHNMRNMVAAGHHLTRQTHSGGGEKHLLREFMSADDILIHHYRQSCKWKAYCRDHWNETIHDDIIPRKYGNILQHKIERILKYVGYDF